MPPPVAPSVQHELLYCYHTESSREIVARGDYNSDGLNDFVITETVTTTYDPFRDDYQITYPDGNCSSAFDSLPVVTPAARTRHSVRVIFGGPGGFYDTKDVLHPDYRVGAPETPGCMERGGVSGINVGDVIMQSGTGVVGRVSKLCVGSMGLPEPWSVLDKDFQAHIIRGMTAPGRPHGPTPWSVDINDGTKEHSVELQDVVIPKPPRVSL